MDTVLFDMDGTLLDTLDDLHVSVNYALEQSGLPLVTFDETREAAGYGSIVLIELLTKHAFVTARPSFNASSMISTRIIRRTAMMRRIRIRASWSYSPASRIAVSRWPS